MVPAFVESLPEAEAGEATKLAFEFLILTAARTSEVLGARWEEIDRAEQTWTIPAERIKAGREHRVPLSPRCIELLDPRGSNRRWRTLRLSGSAIEVPVEHGVPDASAMAQAP